MKKSKEFDIRLNTDLNDLKNMSRARFIREKGSPIPKSTPINVKPWMINVSETENEQNVSETENEQALNFIDNEEPIDEIESTTLECTSDEESDVSKTY